MLPYMVHVLDASGYMGCATESGSVEVPMHAIEPRSVVDLMYAIGSGG